MQESPPQIHAVILFMHLKITPTCTCGQSRDRCMLGKTTAVNPQLFAEQRVTLAPNLSLGMKMVDGARDANVRTCSPPGQTGPEVMDASK